MRHAQQTTHPTVEAPRIDNLSTLQQLTGALIIDDQGTYTRSRLRNCQIGGQAAEDVVFDQVVCERTMLDQTRFTRPQLLDSFFMVCDFAAAEFDKAYVRRVMFMGCKMLGTAFTNADVQDTTIEKGYAEMCRFWDCTFKATRFVACNLHQASFVNSKLSGAVFYNCDLTQADFRGANLRGADLRGSTLDGIQIGIKELKGVIVDSGQAVQLAQILGIVVKDAI